MMAFTQSNEALPPPHIIEKHANDFKKAIGIEKHEIPNYLKKVVERGKLVKGKFKNGGYENVYEYDGKYYIFSGIGKNGFIISMYPRRK